MATFTKEELYQIAQEIKIDEHQVAKQDAESWVDSNWGSGYKLSDLDKEEGKDGLDLLKQHAETFDDNDIVANIQAFISREVASREVAQGLETGNESDAPEHKDIFARIREMFSRLIDMIKGLFGMGANNDKSIDDLVVLDEQETEEATQTLKADQQQGQGLTSSTIAQTDRRNDGSTAKSPDGNL